MKKISMLVFSIAFLILGSVAILWSIEHILTSYGNPLIPSDFWETEHAKSIFTSVKADSLSEFMTGVLVFLQLIGFILSVICKKIRISILKPQRQYNSIAEFKGFIRKNFLISRIAIVLWNLSFFAHIIEALPRGNFWGEIFWLCVLFGIPGVIIFFVSLEMNLAVFFSDPLANAYCKECKHGSLKQFAVTDVEHLGDDVDYTTVTTTTKDGRGKVVDVKEHTRETGRQKRYSHTYTCVNCGHSYKT